MLRFLFLLLSFFTDYRTVCEIAHRALPVGLAAVSIFGGISVCLILRYWLASRGQ
jgi:hypothetical protein